MLILYLLSKQRVDGKWGPSIKSVDLLPSDQVHLVRRPLLKRFYFSNSITSWVPRNKIYGLMGGHFTFTKREEKRSRWKNRRTWLWWMGGFFVNKEIHQVKRWLTECESLGELKRPQWMKGWRIGGNRILGHWLERVLVISLFGCWRYLEWKPKGSS